MSDDNAPIDFADITGASQVTMGFALDLSIAGLDSDDSIDRDEASALTAATWPVFGRPKAGASALTLQRGDERIVICVGDHRFLIDLDEGDAVITAASSGARVVLRASGKASIVSDDVRLASETADEALALASLVKARLDVLQNAHDTHSHASAPTGPVSIPSVIVGPLAGVGSSKIKGVL
jgi:hypothetical protein